MPFAGKGANVIDGVSKLAVKDTKDAKKKDSKPQPTEKDLLRAAMTGVMERKLFIIPSFKIYGGVAGFFDFGPPGCAVKQNITQLWRQHFILEENMLEVECPAVTPEMVLKASGHVDRFTDFMVTDAVTHDCHRADHLLKAALEAVKADDKQTPEKKDEVEGLLRRIDELDAQQLGAALTAYEVTAPETKNAISAPFNFNLMFRTSIGPKGDLTGFLRPETAQGIFVNFKDLLYYNGGKLPFAAAQIGQSYRNEISPRAGLLRVREFTQAEIEHFVDPEDKNHPKFSSVEDLQPLLYSRALQKDTSKQPEAMSLKAAVSQRVIANETLAYFIGRTYLFLVQVGINPQRLRFRQHLDNEMAHYAEDCWDAEIDSTYGWVECVGLADRSAFDLRAHSEASKQPLQAYTAYDKPRDVDKLVAKINKQAIGKTFKKDGKPLLEALEGMKEELKDDKGPLACARDSFSREGKHSISAGGRAFEVTPEMLEIREETQKESGKRFIPSVIEPSFGIGRILYCMFEHAYYQRESSEEKTVFRFQPAVAPLKAAVFPLVQSKDLDEVARRISTKLRRAGLANTVDTTGTTIGKRYARTDELGIPFAITVDRDTLEGAMQGSVTVRERDSTSQVRVPEDDVADLLRRLCSGDMGWADAQQKYPAQAAPSE
ncbi:hypothetical protein CVIRNUC_008279 [Coccomyxa viridis]|uniref:glycine--tRNA ligase n=1 Tax=Coccomyxa viridis TaxID=1274662 RepID=A0AAV1ICJ2_9CHLO|nr:hypothetical protein CVIRNUC_008279 [Coccomyxa viridis]